MNPLLLNFASGLQTERDNLAQFAQSEFDKFPIGIPAGTQPPAPPPMGVQPPPMGVQPPPVSAPPAIPAVATPPSGGYDMSSISQPAQAAWSTLSQNWGQPLSITSGYRSPEHNTRVKGVKGSQHLHGNAFDIDARGMSIPQRQELIRAARKAGFRGIGVYENSLHFDVGGDRAWGPDYHRGSLPAWAEEAVGAPLGNVTMSTKSGQAADGHDHGDASAAQPISKFDHFLERIGMGPSTDPDPDDDDDVMTGRERLGNMLEVASSGFRMLSTGQDMDLSDILQGQAVRRETAMNRLERRREQRQAEAELAAAAATLGEMYPNLAGMAQSGPQGFQLATQLAIMEDQQEHDRALQEARQAAEDARQQAGFEYSTAERIAGQEFTTGEREATQAYEATQSDLDVQRGITQATEIDRTNAEAQVLRDQRQKTAMIDALRSINDPAATAIADQIAPLDFGPAQQAYQGFLNNNQQFAGQLENYREQTAIDLAKEDSQEQALVERMEALYGDQFPDVGKWALTGGEAYVQQKIAEAEAAATRTGSLQSLTELGEIMAESGDNSYLEVASAMAANPDLSYKDAVEAYTNLHPDRAEKLQIFDEFLTWPQDKQNRFIELQRSGASTINLGDTIPLRQWESADARLQAERAHLSESRAATNKARSMQALYESMGYDIPQGPIAGNPKLLRMRAGLAEAGLIDETGENVVGVSTAIQGIQQQLLPTVKLDSQISEKEYVSMLAGLPGVDKLPMGTALSLEVVLKNAETEQGYVNAMEEYLENNNHLNGFDKYYDQLVETGEVPSTVLSEAEFDDNPEKFLNMIDNGFIEVGDIMVMYDPKSGRAMPRPIDEIDIQVWREAGTEARK